MASRRPDWLAEQSADEAQEGQEKMNEDGDEFISGLHRFICVIIQSYFQQRGCLITLKRIYRCTTIIHKFQSRPLIEKPQASAHS